MSPLKTYKIPVSWEVCGFVEVESSSMEDAIRRFDNEIIDECDLPQDSVYIDGSFKRTDDDLPIVDAAEIYECYQ